MKYVKQVTSHVESINDMAVFIMMMNIIKYYIITIKLTLHAPKHYQNLTNAYFGVILNA